MVDRVFVFIKDGYVRDSRDEQGKHTTAVIVFDTDDVFSGKCPVCGHNFAEIDIMDGKFNCADCGWRENDDDLTVIQKYLKYVKEVGNDKEGA